MEQEKFGKNFLLKMIKYNKIIKSSLENHKNIVEIISKEIFIKSLDLIEKNNIESNLIEVKYSFYCNGSTKSLNMILNNKFAINSI